MKVKLYTELLYQAETWSEPRRIICKVEVSEKGENLRFVVTNLQHSRKAYIYETIYCGRGQMENYIKDHKRFLHSDRLSCHKFESNQFRLFLHSAAYVLMHTLRKKGLRGTAWSRAQFDQIQLQVLKVGARVEELKTKIRFHLPSSFPLQALYAKMMAGIHIKRDELMSVMYSTELNSTTSLVTLQRTDRHGILDEKPPAFQLLS